LYFISLAFVAEEDTAEARKALFIQGFEFEAGKIHLRCYEEAIKSLLTRNVCSPTPSTSSSLLQAPSSSGLEDFLRQRKKQDTENILMALKALERVSEDQKVWSAGKKRADKFIFASEGNSTLRIHLTGGGGRPIWSSVIPSRKCVGFFGVRPRIHELDADNDHLWYWRCWKTDEKVVDAFRPDTIMAYVTAQMQPGEHI
jgi:hypothetical protein